MSRARHLAAPRDVRTAVACLLASCVVGCGADGPTRRQPLPAHVFSQNVRRVIVEIDYAEGAEPFSSLPLGVSALLGEPWPLARHNLQALFGEPAKDIVVPASLDAMEPIDAPSGPYRGEDLVDIAERYRNQYSGGDTVSLYAVWLDGYYATDAGVDQTVLGAALPDFGVIGMFKPALAPLASPGNFAVVAFTEQSAFIHELGHALGLVNTGLADTSAHEDLAHPGHCNNPQCVMYWANEGGADLFQFVRDRLSTGSDVMFDAACLADTAAAANR